MRKATVLSCRAFLILMIPFLWSAAPFAGQADNPVFTPFEPQARDGDNQDFLGVALTSEDTEDMLSSARFSGMERWTPPVGSHSVALKAVDACYWADRDIYGIVAVYQEQRGDDFVDSVYHLEVNGETDELEAVDHLFRTQPGKVITHVDCVGSDDGNFLAWDVSDYGVIWARVHAGGVRQRHITSAGVLFPANPKLAYRNDRLVVAWHYYDYEHGVPDCGFMWETYEPDGTWLSRHLFWPDGMTHGAYDVEWGKYNFLLGFFWKSDFERRCRFSTLALDESGDSIGDFVDHKTWSCTSINDDLIPTGLELVYSDTPRNTDRFFIGQTNRETYWIEQDGSGMAGEETYGVVWTYPACEYWGSGDRIAHVYATLTHRWFLGSLHADWAAAPGPAQALYPLHPGYFPLTCTSTESTDEDSEVLLVSYHLGEPLAVYWSFQPKD